jgi:DNA-binding CsgD family transcriptional regulator
MFVRVLSSVDVEASGHAQQVAVTRPMTGQWARGQVLELVQPVSAQLSADPEDPSVAALTRREREVLTCIAMAYDNREIADELMITVRTVNRHLENIRGKLGPRRRSELVRLARQINP